MHEHTLKHRAQGIGYRTQDTWHRAQGTEHEYRHRKRNVYSMYNHICICFICVYVYMIFCICICLCLCTSTCVYTCQKIPKGNVDCAGSAIDSRGPIRPLSKFCQSAAD